MKDKKTAAVDDILALVDLERYPVHNLDGDEGAAFVRSCHEHMTAHGWCSLDGFLKSEAIEMLVDEANSMLPGAEQLTITRNIYTQPADRSENAPVPARKEYTHHPIQLADDQIPNYTLVKRLYHCDELMDLIRRIEGKVQLFRSADEFQALNIVALPPGEWHGWHYDKDECVVTLLLQAADEGGDFVFIPNCRTDDDEDVETVSRFLEGDMTVASTFGRAAGTLTLFRGEYSLHGVTEIKGDRHRITAIFTYDEQPDRRSSDDVNIRVYGPRVERILAEREAGARVD